MADPALGFSVVAILVALWAAWSSHRSARASQIAASASQVAARASQVLARNDEERRAEERERRELAEAAAQRADLRVRHEKTGGEHYFVVTNNGPALARDVGIEPTALRGDGIVPHVVAQPGRLPVEEVHPGAEARFRMSIGPAEDVHVRLTWNDEEDGRHDERRWVQRSDSLSA